MEEIRSSEALDHEILEDARKKAERILRQVDVDSAALAAERDTKTAHELEQLGKRIEARLATFEKEVLARAPLEKKRKRIDFMERKLDEAILGFFGGIEPSDRAKVLGSRLARAAEAFSGRAVIVEARGLGKAEAEGIVASAFPGVPVLRVEETTARQDEAGLIVSAEDGAMLFRATFAEVKADLLDTRREELARALFPGLESL
jgi:V/A-type H+/Na+-transporting ATPase subunit E